MKTEYKGFDIEYAEEAKSGEHWFSRQLNLTAPQLAGLKRKIDSADIQRRRVEIKALRIGGRWTLNDDKRAKLVPCTITLIVDKDECWIKFANGDREKEYLHNLFPDTEEVRAAYSRYMEALREREEAQERAEQRRAEIPRVEVTIVSIEAA